jgi:hypothetical protein
MKLNLDDKHGKNEKETQNASHQALSCSTLQQFYEGY